MSNPIPPFVCCTPPPIDCTVDVPPPVDDDFGDFAAVEDQFEASSLPATPVHTTKLPDEKSNIHSSIPTIPSPDSELIYEPEDDSESAAVVNNSSFEEELPNLSSYPPTSTRVDLKTDLPFVIEANSPPPLDFEPVDDDLTPCDDLDNDEEVDDFPVDDVAKYDDNISLPSLKFDMLNNVSKSTTPVSDELVKSNYEDSDSINAFQPISSAELKLEESREDDTLSQEAADIPLDTRAAVNESKEEREDDFCELQQTNKEDCSEIAELKEIPPSYLSDLKPGHTEPPDDDSRTKKSPEHNDFAFEADFSQFSSFEPAVVPPPVTSQIVEKKELTKKSSLDDLEADDFDDFQDFAAAIVAPAAPVAPEVQRQTSVNEPPPAQVTVAQSSEPTESIDHNSDDDEFGEFSEVVESNSIAATHIPVSNGAINLANLNDKLKSILEMMFPFANVTKEEQEEDSENDQISKELTSSTAINQIDTAKALEYQWSNSEVRHSLIKSLGVDSRNILYGEKWNSSMPRYAANLSFNPLEPMKSDKSAAGSNASSSSSSATDYRKRSESLTSSASASTKADVPAAEFDWNSSGLVNPLDGVKEILHERTVETIHTPQLGESYSSVDEQSSTTINSNDNIYDHDKQLRRFIDEEAISTTIEFKSNADASAIITATTATATTITTTTSSNTAATTSNALSNDYINITCGDDFQSGVLETNMDAVIANSLAHNHKTHTAKYQESSKTDLETELQHSGVVTTSTYAGPLKETHIFTPSKSDSTLVRSSSKTPRTSESKCPIDFDYEIAAAGIIIDEAVVKKEYRDLEYNPGFDLKYREEPEFTHRASPEIHRDKFGLNAPPKQSYLIDDLTNKQKISSRPSDLNELSDFVSEKIPEVVKPSVKAAVPKTSSFDDEFSDFQSVPPPPPTVVPSTIIPSSTSVELKSSPSHLRKVKEGDRSSTGSRTGTPISLIDEMILSPAILLPQAIQMENKPKIEWPEPGINPEELARIEELFPQPKSGSNKPSPSHNTRSQQPQQQNRATPQSGADDDDWSDFVSVPAAINHIQSISQQFQKRHASPAKSASDPNDDEWSDFVSSAPPAAPAANHMRQSAYPQFNSAAWQNANFYNNPLSAYASPPTSFYYQPPPQQQQTLSNNLVPNLSNVNNNTATNNNIINNNSINQYLINNQANQPHHHHHHQQHIQMMRDFSSMSPMDGGSNMATSSLHHQYVMQTGAGYGYSGNRSGLGNMQHHGKASQFGAGSSKVAPSISLIPDLGFVAPTHTSFVSVPKNSFITKK